MIMMSGAREGRRQVRFGLDEVHHKEMNNKSINSIDFSMH